MTAERHPKAKFKYGQQVALIFEFGGTRFTEPRFIKKRPCWDATHQKWVYTLGKTMDKKLTMGQATVCEESIEKLTTATIYVDDLFNWPSRDWRQGEWCHMWTDGTDADLVAFAASIDLKAEYLQTANPRFHHFDLRPSKRFEALAKGAKPMPLKDWLKQKTMV